MNRTTAVLSFRAQERLRLVAQIERWTQLPLTLLSIMALPVYIGPFIWQESAQEFRVFVGLGSFIWLAFVTDFGLRFVLIVDKRAFLRSNWVELLIVVVPFLRPFGVLLLILYGSKTFQGIRQAFGLRSLLTYATALVVVSSMVIRSVEIGHSATLHSFGDALWWSMETITTVGYGDIVPVTAIGRIVASILMVGGISLYGALTANLASWMTHWGHAEEDRNRSELEDIRRELQALRQEIASLRSDSK